jgi:hypothetical protein
MYEPFFATDCLEQLDRRLPARISSYSHCLFTEKIYLPFFGQLVVPHFIKESWK